MGTDDDDWSNISDVASRKRIQNRIAQRTYRNNQKRRIEQLEYYAMVSRLGQEAAGYDNLMGRQTLSGATPVTSSLLPPGQLLHQPVCNPQSGCNHVVPPIQYPQDPYTHQSGMNKRRRTRSSNRLSASSSDNFPSIEPDGAGGTTQDTTNANDAVLPGAVESVKSITTDTKNDDSIQMFPSPSPLGQEFEDDENWYDSTFPSLTHQGDFILQHKEGDNDSGKEEGGKEPGKQQPHFQSGQIPSPVSSTSGIQLKGDEKPSTSLPDDASMKQRFAYVSLCAKNAGFKSLESMISSYYTSNFHDTPALASSQRLDRNRQLPRLLAEICDSMSTWSSWEARGCKEELLKVAETMFLKEVDNLTTNPKLHGFLSDAGLTNRYGDKKSRDELIVKIESVFQSEVPNLWAFVSVMTENSNQQPCGTEKGRTYAAFGLISLMYCSRTGIDSHIGNLIKSCLDIN